jgi:hypothetical protein
MWSICSQVCTHTYALPAQYCTPLASQRMQTSSVHNGRHARIVFSGTAYEYARAPEAHSA